MEFNFPPTFPPGWRQQLMPESHKSYFQKLMHFLEGEYAAGKVFPPREHIWRAFELADFRQTKVVILGQDPYHGLGQAMGLSFSVPNTLSKKPPTLRNIFKELETDLKIEVKSSHSD